MDNSVKMFSQVASAAGVTEQQAIVACYLLTLSRAGKDMDEAAALLRMERCDVRDHARSWAIPFTDYTPAAVTTVLEWRKIERGHWRLFLGGVIVADAVSAGKGNGEYQARLHGGKGWQWHGSSASVTMRRASREIERDSLERFGADDIAIMGPDANGDIAKLAPSDIGDRRKLTAALHH